MEINIFVVFTVNKVWNSCCHPSFYPWTPFYHISEYHSPFLGLADSKAHSRIVICRNINMPTVWICQCVLSILSIEILKKKKKKYPMKENPYWLRITCVKAIITLEDTVFENLHYYYIDNCAGINVLYKTAAIVICPSKVLVQYLQYSLPFVCLGIISWLSCALSFFTWSVLTPFLLI